MIGALCVVQDADRPTVATFIGLHDAGVRLKVICPVPSRAHDELVARGVPVAEFRLRKQVDLAGIRELRRELVEGEYDILHVFGNKALQNGLLAARGLPVKIVAYRGIVGNVSFLSPISWMRFLNPRIDRVVCVAEAVRQHFLAMRPRFLRVPEEKLVTIYKGHSIDWYQGTPADLTQFGVPANAFSIVCVANYRPRKGIEFLVDAVARLPAEWNAYLLLVGNMNAPALEKRIESSRMADRIMRLGQRSDAPAITAACDVFVLPSIKREGLSRALIEAMACGVAPLVTDCGGSSELVIHGESGLVVPVRDAEALADGLRRLHDDTGLRLRMGKAAQERIRAHFAIEDTIRRTLELYRQLVRGPEEGAVERTPSLPHPETNDRGRNMR